MGWTHPTAKQPAERIAVLSDQPAGPARLRAYGKRMLIEQSFKEDKSGGFDLDHTRLLNPQRLERLLLAVALATLWAHELGEYVLRGGPARRQTIDAGTQRELESVSIGPPMAQTVYRPPTPALASVQRTLGTHGNKNRW